MHSAVPEKVKETLMSQYKHPIHQELEETAKKIGGHGGMDFIMDYRLVYCLRNGLPLDMDVYDLAEWCCMADLTRLSIENGNAPVAVPDFTRGNWNKVMDIIMLSLNKKDNEINTDFHKKRGTYCIGQKYLSFL